MIFCFYLHLSIFQFSKMFYIFGNITIRIRLQQCYLSRLWWPWANDKILIIFSDVKITIKLHRLSTVPTICMIFNSIGSQFSVLWKRTICVLLHYNYKYMPAYVLNSKRLETYAPTHSGGSSEGIIKEVIYNPARICVQISGPKL